MTYRWKGNEYLPGIPTDDLTDEFVDALDDATKATVRRIYEKVKDKAVKAPEPTKTETVTTEEGVN